MKTEYNSEAFSPEEVEKGLHWELIKTLVEYNSRTSDGYYNDIHLTTDGYCIIVEWVKIPYNHEWGGEFMHVSDSAEIKYPVNFPDGTYDWASSEDEKQHLIQSFIIENPDWRCDSWDHWVNIKTGEEKVF